MALRHLNRRPVFGGVCIVEDMQAHLEKLLKDAAECKLISDLATDRAKRDLYWP